MPVIGAHVDSADPIPAATEVGAEAAQFFLADPQGWKAPVEHPHAAQIKDSGLTIYIHAPYVLNVATLNNRIRIPSRKLLHQHAAAAAAIGAKGLIVHGGHLNAKDDPETGLDNWRKTFARAVDDGGFPLPILIENTAGGGNAMARRFDRLAAL
ncbi:MAG TPA: TIM barrel protein, partial [Jatrophihabitantaceae bacterium]|nr:TIM barrel protein [Jatrophihabitantaceae bacterium]